MGFKYNGSYYVYQKDIQGNIIAIVDSNGNTVVKYDYDAWGNCLVTGNGTLSNANPFRYRGYYYDAQTGLYYLQTRYYDPTTGRFISPDNIDYANPETVDGLNLYAYCNNNPVMNVDPTGNAEWWQWLLTAISVVAATVAGIALTIVSFGAASPLVAFGAAVLGGALLGFSGAMVGDISSQVNSAGLSNVDLGQSWVAGGIGFITGAVTGALSYGVGAIASNVGQGIGMVLNSMSVSGKLVSDVFGKIILPEGFKILGGVAGSLGASVFGDFMEKKLINQIYDTNAFKDTLASNIMGWVIQLIKGLT
ncbi:MAG: RHS repeat-associated core domain-containing protein [Candidatus Coproplasma sp.]